MAYLVSVHPPGWLRVLCGGELSDEGRAFAVDVAAPRGDHLGVCSGFQGSAVFGEFAVAFGDRALLVVGCGHRVGVCGFELGECVFDSPGLEYLLRCLKDFGQRSKVGFGITERSCLWHRRSRRNRGRSARSFGRLRRGKWWRSRGRSPMSLVTVGDGSDDPELGERFPACACHRFGVVDLRACPLEGVGASGAGVGGGESVLGKIGGLLREEAPVTVKYAFIAAEEGNHSVVSMCRWAKVSRSGYYAWRDREPSATTQRREILAAEIRFCFEHSDSTYGYRVSTPNWPAGARRWIRVRSARSCVSSGLVPCQPRPFRPVTTLAGDAADLPDLVRRDFTADAPATKLVGDITYIRTWEGWLYPATVLDCYSKKVIGYAMAEHMRTELVSDALGMAARNAAFNPGGTIFHSERFRVVV